jgi:hypothetical protein
VAREGAENGRRRRARPLHAREELERVGQPALADRVGQRPDRLLGGVGGGLGDVSGRHRSARPREQRGLRDLLAEQQQLRADPLGEGFRGARPERDTLAPRLARARTPRPRAWRGASLDRAAGSRRRAPAGAAVQARRFTTSTLEGGSERPDQRGQPLEQRLAAAARLGSRRSKAPALGEHGSARSASSGWPRASPSSGRG